MNVNAKILNKILANGTQVYIRYKDTYKNMKYTYMYNIKNNASWTSGVYWKKKNCFSSVQFSSVAQSCSTLWDRKNCSTPGLPVHHQLPEFTQTHVHWVGDAIQPSHPLSSPSPPSLNASQHQSFFQWVNSLHEVAKVLEFQLQHHSLQRNPRADLL